ncbi:MAG: hypothetical protein CL811_09525 [Colwelliaceae bacterium]|nr:hypothetical protein [Colwelliaceae bacterium]
MKFVITPIAKTLPVLFTCANLVACGGSSSDSNAANDTNTTEQTTETTNVAPTVNAGIDQTVTAGDDVVLSASIEDDGNHTIEWTQASGITVELSGNNTDTLSFIAPNVESDQSILFQVTVDDGVNEPVTDEITITVTPEQITENPDAEQDSSAWIINTNDERASHILNSSSNLGVLVNVQSVDITEVNGEDYTVVTSQGIPNYNVEITEEIYDSLTARPRSNTDFVGGAPTIGVGDIVSFGQDIGYSSNRNCGTDAGYGYWPPGPDCPTDSTREGYFPQEPTPTEEDCDTGLGKVGLWVNGSSVYNWEDGQSYNNQGTWQNLAPVAEQYDVDICGGHAANGDYHHHFYSSCLADMVGDKADGHSPLYGYAADGYPIYGPWEAEGVLAKSAWVVRDYSSSSETGCADDSRSCTLVDSYDPSQGTESSDQGPDFDQTVTTLSGNELVAYNGYYKEDYYWNSELTQQGDNYLDQYNGHYDETRGYHYHVTVEEVDGKLTPAFPYIVGEKFAGSLGENSLAMCSTGNTPPGGPRG